MRRKYATWKDKVVTLPVGARVHFFSGKYTVVEKSQTNASTSFLKLTLSGPQEGCVGCLVAVQQVLGTPITISKPV